MPQMHAPWNVQVMGGIKKYSLTDLEFIGRHGVPPTNRNHGYTIPYSGGQQMSEPKRQV